MQRNAMIVFKKIHTQCTHTHPHTIFGWFSFSVSLWVDYSATYFQRHPREFWDTGNNNLYGRTFLNHLSSFWLKKKKFKPKKFRLTEFYISETNCNANHAMEAKVMPMY